MTLTYWERQFSLRQVLPDFEHWLAKMQNRSDHAAQSLDLEKIAYGPDPRQWVELSGDAMTDGLVPVFIHCGYWRALEAERHRFVLPTMKAQAGLVANVEYRLLPDVSLGQIVDDACSAVRCIAEHTGKRLLVVGHSAGGHLASIVAHREPRIVAGAIAVSGLFDLTPLPFSFLAQEVGLRGGDVEGLSPLHEWEGSAAHITACVGENETPEFVRQAHMFASTHGAQSLVVQGAHHMNILEALADPSGDIAKHLCDRLTALS